MRTGKQIRYPQSRREDLVEEISGFSVADPYRWLEDVDSDETRQWIAEQNELTFQFLEDIESRTQITERIRQLWDYEKFNVPKKRGGRYFFTKNDGLQNQSVLYWMASLEDDPICLLDPNTLSEDGTIALMDYVPSKDGRFVAYSLAEAGSDWQTWRVRDVVSGKDLDDVVEWVKFSAASWTKDEKGFFYSRFDAPKEGTTYKGANYYQRLYYHELGTDQSDDPVIYERPDQKEWGFWAEVTPDGRYLVITVSQGTQVENGLFLIDLEGDGEEVEELLIDFDASYLYIGNDASHFYFLTNLEAPLSRLVAIDINHPDPQRWQVIIPESTNILVDVVAAGDRFLAHYLEDATSRLIAFDKRGQKLETLRLPGLGTVIAIDGNPDDQELFYSFNSINQPALIYRYNIMEGSASPFRQPTLGFESEDYETTQHFFSSKDGTKIPMFVSRHKEVNPSPDTPLYLYGYGGFNISQTPNFSAANLVWMEMGGIFVQVNLRGGGEYGKNWHEAGMKLNKQNVFDDFIAAAEYLIEEGYTSQKKLAIGGRSNGGLLVGACLTQRPDLFGGALMYVGVLDMVRFTEFTIGWAWVSDYGSPDDPQELKALLDYSPYHNLATGTEYPPTLILTGDHDDRVFPAHSFKFAAALQAAQGGPAPALIRIDAKAGHGLGKPTEKLVEESADGWAFLVRALSMEV